MTLESITLTNPGTPAAAIRQHYDVGNDFYQLWLDPSMSYSCALWAKDEAAATDTLEAAQLRKIDFHIRQAQAAGKQRVLDIGCGWGATLRRLVENHGVEQAVGLTLSENQAAWIRARRQPRIEARLESWSDYQPDTPFDALISIGAFEHFAHPDLSYAETVAAHRHFFQRCHAWLKPGGYFSLQTLVQMNMQPADLHQIVKETLPELALPTLAGIAEACEHRFELTYVQNDREDYVRTCRAWLLRIKQHRKRAVAEAGETIVARYETWLKYCMVSFHTGTAALMRLTLRRIDQPGVRTTKGAKQQKRIATLLSIATALGRTDQPAVAYRPAAGSDQPTASSQQPAAGSVPQNGHAAPDAKPHTYQGASTAAIQHHYDVGNDFYRLWLDPSLTYSCALWAEDGHPEQDTLAAAQLRKIDYFVQQAGAAGAQRVLEIGCGWGATQRRLVETHGVGHAVGLTLSAAQLNWIQSFAQPRLEPRLENWFAHQPTEPYDAILSIAAFEAFAHHGLTEAEKIAAYRTFFQRCHQWLKSGGRLAIQTITYENFDPATASAFVSEIFPESDLPRLTEIFKATEHLFEVTVLRNDREHYVRTLQLWLAALKANRQQAVALVGEEVVARYEKYLSFFIIGFHRGTINLARLTLRRIDTPR